MRANGQACGPLPMTATWILQTATWVLWTATHGVVSGLEIGVSRRGIHMSRGVGLTHMLHLSKFGDSRMKLALLSLVQILTFTCKMGEILLAVAPSNARTLYPSKVHQANQFDQANIHDLRFLAVLPHS